MTYKEFEEIVSNSIYLNMREKVVKSIISNPERFSGGFRLTSGLLRVQSFALASAEISYADGINRVISRIIGSEYGAGVHLIKNKTVLTKMRDDHDSGKRSSLLIAPCDFVWFLDDRFKKNKDYYGDRAVYGADMFTKLSMSGVEDFKELQRHGLLFQKDVCSDIEVIFSDKRQELTRMSSLDWKKLVENYEIIRDCLLSVVDEDVLVNQINKTIYLKPREFRKDIRERIDKINEKLNKAD